MAVQNTALLVFLFPVVMGMAFGSFVLSGILAQPDRELNMWPFENIFTPPPPITEDIKIQGLQSQYSVSATIGVKVMVNNSDFDCGDLYITIYDTKTSPKEVVAQNGFFSQCFSTNKLALPIDDTFSEKIDKAGEYEMVVEMNDSEYKKTITATSKFRVQ
ncbi:MAG TPA: hypothetical protein VLA53_01615 [Nitrosopumilaceae archaeon]|nr:hypothetical protein [Nitrosopumilaceae archaeon]